LGDAGVASQRHDDVVVDASALPCVRGFFIVSAIDMLSEQASDVILADARKAGRRAWPNPST
jgi:hypothetical protein